MSEIEQLEKIRTQARIRQKAYYERNKEILNAKRRAIYAKGIEDRPEPEPVKATHVGEHKTDYSKSRGISYEQAINALNSLDIKAKTRDTYKDDLKRLMKLSDCNDDLIKCFRNSEKLIDIIENSKKNNGEPYAVNTKKNLYQMILYLIDNLHLPITKTVKEKYSKVFGNYKIKSFNVNKEKVSAAPIYTFKQYLEKVKDEFGPDSKMFVLSSLYFEVTARDDYVLEIVPAIKDANNNDVNYIVVTKKGNLTLIINEYKTSTKYGQIKVKLSSALSKMIRNYMESENLTYGDYLFGDKNLSSFVSKNNKKLGINDGINYYRHMNTTDLLKTQPNENARRELAERMGHSPITQLQYLRENINED